MNQIDDSFYKRADEHIELSNSQISEDITKGKVSASFMYSVARFNAWLSATGWNSGAELKKNKNKTIKYFMKEYETMLNENLDDYINNFDKYMKP
jgi:hypothetical protein